MDIDAGPILLKLSPSGTALFAGSATSFDETSTTNKILRAVELAGHTIKLGKKHYYLLANIIGRRINNVSYAHKLQYTLE